MTITVEELRNDLVFLVIELLEIYNQAEKVYVQQLGQARFGTDHHVFLFVDDGEILPRDFNFSSQRVKIEDVVTELGFAFDERCHGYFIVSITNDFLEVLVNGYRNTDQFKRELEYLLVDFRAWKAQMYISNKADRMHGVVDWNLEGFLEELISFVNVNLGYSMKVQCRELSKKVRRRDYKSMHLRCDLRIESGWLL